MPKTGLRKTEWDKIKHIKITIITSFCFFILDLLLFRTDGTWQSELNCYREEQQLQDLEIELGRQGMSIGGPLQVGAGQTVQRQQHWQQQRPLPGQMNHVIMVEVGTQLEARNSRGGTPR